MNPDDLRDLASRLTAGEGLSADEETALLAELQQAGKRDAILADEAVDTLLRAAVHVTASREDFITATLARAAATTPPAPVEEAPAFDFPVEPNRPRVRPSRRGRWLIPIGCAAALLIGVAVWPRPRPDGPTKEPPPLVKNEPKPPVKPPVEPPVKPPPSPVADNRFARLAKSENAVWETPVKDGERLPAGPLKLTRGTAELVFDTGTVATLTGPAVLDLRGGDEVYLRQGSLAAKSPDAGGFKVLTPVSRVVDRGAEFDVQVGDRGATNAVVRRGRLAVTPQRDGERPAKTLELTPGDLDRVNMTQPDHAAKLLPVSTRASGRKGQFVGLLSVDGRTGVFQTPEAFQKFEGAVVGSLRASAEQFQQQWSFQIQVTGRGAMAVAWVNLNGEQYRIEVYGDDEPKMIEKSR